MSEKADNFGATPWDLLEVFIIEESKGNQHMRDQLFQEIDLYLGLDKDIMKFEELSSEAQNVISRWEQELSEPGDSVESEAKSETKSG